MNLESDLRALEVDWPETPHFRLEPARSRRRARYVLAFAIVAVAVGAAFAVPQSRGAILRFFHLRGASIEFVGTLPRADERPLTDGLGEVVSLSVARSVIPGLLLPPLDRPPPLHYAPGEIVSLVFEHRGAPVLLSELRGGGGSYLKKLASFGTTVEAVLVGGHDGVWITGAPHVVTFPRRPARLAGDVLLWETRSTTYRLEGPSLTRDDAIELAQSLRKG
jgi:hypothetical protein